MKGDGPQGSSDGQAKGEREWGEVCGGGMGDELGVAMAMRSLIRTASVHGPPDT